MNPVAYKARATYCKVIERFGPVRPFVNIVEAEDRHVSALLAQFRRLRADPPFDTWQDRVKCPDSLAQACADGCRPWTGPWSAIQIAPDPREQICRISRLTQVVSANL